MPIYISANHLKSSYIEDKKVAKIYVGDKIAYQSQVGYNKVLEKNTWEQIAQAHRDGIAQDLWKVGDTKSIHVEGTVGTLEVNGDFDAVIIGFDHNAEIEGTGITFQLFQKDGTPLALVDSKYTSDSTNGMKYFNMNHSGDVNYGGWAACDMRYDILGSTDVQPDNYGSQRESGDKGYDPTANCATDPVDGTLMAALPADLRAVMKPMKKYSDNKGGGSNTASDVSATTDYLPLLSEYEIFGKRSYANSTEQTYQKQYAYYAASNSKVKYRHSSPTSSANWWERSAFYNNGSTFCGVLTIGFAYWGKALVSEGIAPIFMVG